MAVEKKCATCGKSFLTWGSQPKKYCCRQCYLAYVHVEYKKECPVCGTHFEVSNSKSYVKQFCSPKCAYKSIGEKHRKQPVVIECLHCGKVFSVIPAKKNAKFCSVECHDNWQRRGQVARTCKNCGRLFYTRAALNRVFCSKACQYKYLGKTEWDNEKVVEQIQSMVMTSEPLNAAYCRDKRLDLFKASIRIFGSWSDALKASHVDFEKVRLDRKTSSYKGLIFEKLVEELYRLSGINVRRKPYIKGCQPDFIEENTGIWVDVKLRSWTVGIEKTISKYIEHADTIQIIYLGGGSREYRTSEGITFVSVYDKFPIIDRLESSHEIRTSLKELEKQDVRDKRFKTWSETWSRERIVAQIRKIVSSGEPIHPSYLQENYPRLYSAITVKRYFPDWASAVQEAGFDPLKYIRRRTQPYQTYEEAKKAVDTLGIRKSEDYWKRYKEDFKLPANPNKTYKNKGWKNWVDFLGR